jgi:hypothetical protein
VPPGAKKESCARSITKMTLLKELEEEATKHAPLIQDGVGSW